MKNGVIAVLVVALLGLSWWHFGEVTEAPEVAADRFGAVREVVRSMQGAEGFREASVGFCLLDSGGAVVVDERGGEAMIPASALKTVATATALELLGPGFRFETRVGVTAEV
ncbi:MAG: D-alanyl-D-alanine carboxypeptidase, partial [Verrucomicrobiales bacterium]|nr:D-alanyl-D-alanine carboxypeptidase [Verrucomicrobiales bacterium]